MIVTFYVTHYHNLPILKEPRLPSGRGRPRVRFYDEVTQLPWIMENAKRNRRISEMDIVVARFTFRGNRSTVVLFLHKMRSQVNLGWIFFPYGRILLLKPRANLEHGIFHSWWNAIDVIVNLTVLICFYNFIILMPYVGGFSLHAVNFISDCIVNRLKQVCE